jgi:hypothetical protein
MTTHDIDHAITLMDAAIDLDGLVAARTALTRSVLELSRYGAPGHRLSQAPERRDRAA